MSETDAGNASQWPRIGTRMWAFLPEYPTNSFQVEVAATVEGNLRFTTPVFDETGAFPEPPKDDDTMLVGWGHAAGYTQIEARFLQAIEDPSHVWEVESVGSFATQQRRQYVRVNYVTPAEVVFGGSELAIAGMLVDLSEGGLKCTVDEEVVKPTQQSVAVSFPIDGQEMTFNAAIAWWAPANEGRQSFGAAFVGVPISVSDRVRSYVFALQMEERRRVREME